VPARVKVYFDGGCRGERGKLEIAVVTGGRTTILTDLGYGTSSDAEWLALIEALRTARALDLADVILLGDSADVVAKANGTLRCRGDALHHLARFRAEAGGAAPPLVRRIKRTQNLAGIALARLHNR
jgi:ribonuclease HI